MEPQVYSQLQLALILINITLIDSSNLSSNFGNIKGISTVGKQKESLICKFYLYFLSGNLIIGYIEHNLLC